MILLALSVGLLLSGCNLTDYMWTVWLSNSSDQPFTVELTRTDVPGAQAYKLPPRSTFPVDGSGDGSDIVVRLYRANCQLAATIAGNEGATVSIAPSGQVIKLVSLSQLASDAPVAVYGAEMALGAGCSAEWRAANPSFSLPPSAGAAVSPPPTGSTSPSASAGRCAGSALSVSITNSSAAGGSAGGWIRFQNTGSTPCTIAGFPVLAGISPDGKRTSARHADELLDAPRLNGTPTTTLQPGQSAFAAFAGSDTPVGSPPSCPPAYVALEVAAPGSLATTRLPSFITWLGQDLPSCTGIEVMPVIGGDSLPGSLASLRP